MERKITTNNQVLERLANPLLSLRTNRVDSSEKPKPLNHNDQHAERIQLEAFRSKHRHAQNAIAHCLIEYWDTEKKFCHNTFHCFFFLDYYLTLKPKKFSPPAPFTFSVFEDVMPERVYTKEEQLTYLSFYRQKSHDLISELTEEVAASHWVNQSERWTIR